MGQENKDLINVGGFFMTIKTGYKTDQFIY